MEQAKKESILDAASKVFSRFGFKKGSVDEIARDAGVAKGTVYLACASKEDLFYQTVHRELRSWIGECARHIDPRVPADKLLETLARASIGFLAARPLVRDLLLGAHAGALPSWRARFDELRALGRANVIEILKLGIKQGRFRGDLDLDHVASLLQDLELAGYIFHAKEMHAHPEMIEPRMRAGLDLVLNGLRDPKRS